MFNCFDKKYQKFGKPRFGVTESIVHLITRLYVRRSLAESTRGWLNETRLRSTLLFVTLK